MTHWAGQRLDNYILIRILGSGGFGEVYLAEHVHQKTQFAVKILPQLADDELPNFLNEARTVRLKHPHIVQILDFGVVNHTPFLVMEYAPNGTLRQRHPKGTQLPLEGIVFYTKQIADALQYAHNERLVHRDVKPENMLLGRNNEVLLSDFGIATIAHSSRSQGLQDMAGTITYMAPEQIQGKPVLASDQYALGITVYEWMCGKRPFNGSAMEIATQHMIAVPPPLSETVPAISPLVQKVVLTALEKDPGRRFANVSAFANALEQAWRSEATLFPSPSSSSPLPLAPTKPKQPATSVPIQTLSNVTSAPNTPINTLPPTVSAASSSSPAISLTTSSSPGQQQTPQKSKRRLVFYPVLALLLLSLIGAIAMGAYYFGISSYQPWQQPFRNAQELITQANGETSGNPVLALQHLASAQKILNTLLQSQQLNDAQRQQVDDLLQGNFIREVKAAIRGYDAQYGIVSSCNTTATTTVVPGGVLPPIHEGNNTIQIQSMVELSPSSVYILGKDKHLYLVNGNSELVSTTPAPSASTQILSIATSGSLLFALQAQGSTSRSYTLDVYQQDPHAEKLDLLDTASIDGNLMQGSKIPNLIAAWNSDVYVLLGPNAASNNNALLLDYTVNTANTLNTNPIQTLISVEANITSLTAFPNHQLFLLYHDGNIGNLILNGNSTPPSAGVILMDHPVATPLSIDADSYTPSQPVPTATPLPTDVSTLVVSGKGVLISGMVNTTPHLYILDPQNNRLLNLTVAYTSVIPVPHVNASIVTLHLIQQYSSSSFYAPVASLTFDNQDGDLFLLLQESSSLLIPQYANADAEKKCA